MARCRRAPCVVAGCAVGASAADLDRQALAMIEGVVPRPGHRQGRSPEAGPRAAGLFAAERRRAARRGQAASRPRPLATIKLAGRRPLPRRLARRREAGAERPRHDLDRRVARPPRPTAATATTATRSTRRRSPSAPSARACGTTARLRGVKDPADPASAPIVQYTWGKLWNSKAYSACSNMPRFGQPGLLDEDQIRAPDGVAARPEVAGQPVDRAEPAARPVAAPTLSRHESKREFVQVLAAAVGRPAWRLARYADADAATAAAGAVRRAAVRQRVAAAHHRLPRAAQADLLSRAERQPRRRRHARPAAAPGGRSIAARRPALRPGSAAGARLHLPRLRAAPRAATARSAASRTWPRWSSS